MVRYLHKLTNKEKYMIKVEYQEVVFDEVSDAFVDNEKNPLYVTYKGAYILADKRDIYNVVSGREKVLTLCKRIEFEINPMQEDKKGCLEALKNCPTRPHI